jgi:copper resistance protein B
MNRIGSVVAATAVLAVAVHATAQTSMQGMNMPGMTMTPAKKKPAATKPAPAHVAKKTPAARATAPTAAGAHAMGAMDGSAMSGTDMSNGAKDKPAGQSMSGMDMSGTMPEASKSSSGMPGMAMPGGGQDDKNMAAMPGMAMPDMAMDGMAATGTALPAGNAPAPHPFTANYADRVFPAAIMDRSRSATMRESGGQNFYQVLFNLAEYQFRDGKDGYRWDGQAWFGGDVNRLIVKTEGEGTFREGVDAAEVQALYSRAVGPYFNLQGGVRHDLQPTPTRTYATVGIEGLAPYMFETEAAVFLSTKGELLGRLAGWYDERITQRLILQPRVELNLSAQNVRETRIGAGLSNAELGLRLRYEIAREFAPYVGVSYDIKTGRTADYARADGKDTKTASLVAGIRVWF